MREGKNIFHQASLPFIASLIVNVSEFTADVGGNDGRRRLPRRTTERGVFLYLPDRTAGAISAKPKIEK